MQKVPAAATEGDVRVGIAAHVEAQRLGETPARRCSPRGRNSTTFSPSAIRAPPSSTSRVAVRRIVIDGLDQRRNSSTALAAWVS